MSAASPNHGSEPLIIRRPGPDPRPTHRPRLSVVVPVFNEEGSLPVLHQEIVAALEPAGIDFEVLYVDDCSSDGSLGVMKRLWEQDPRVRIVKFKRNSGQTAAMAAGFDRARGELVATLDGDLQNDPADIPRMISILEQGYDIVAGWRRRREDGFVLRRLPSRLANRLISLISGVRIHDTGCTLKIFRSALVRSLSIYADQHRFLPVLSVGSGARVTETVVNHRARRYGHSKYGLSRATRVLLDLLSIKLLAQFSQRPLHYFGILALGFLGVGLAFAMLGMFSIHPSSNGTAEVLSVVSAGDRARQDWELVAASIVMVVMMTVVYFAMLGLLGELAVKASGMHRRRILDRILNELH
jgi:glycosyltransferase involved in cell wall biosynthesis